MTGPLARCESILLFLIVAFNTELGNEETLVKIEMIPATSCTVLSSMRTLTPVVEDEDPRPPLPVLEPEPVTPAAPMTLLATRTELGPSDVTPPVEMLTA